MTHYNLKWLLKKLEKDPKADFLFFWGHTNKSKEQTGPFMLSQWYPSPFMVDGKMYMTTEHWMMAGKAKLFGDFETLDEIIQADSPKQAKALGRKVKGFISEVWEDNCHQIVVEGNKHKFSQHPALKEYLMSTGDKIIVEASPVDAIWGIGLPQDNKYAKDPHSWRGLNLLGFALMQVRDILGQKS